MQHFIKDEQQAKIFAQEYLKKIGVSLADEYTVFDDVHPQNSNAKHFVARYEKAEALSSLKGHSYLEPNLWHIVATEPEGQHQVDVSKSGEVIRFLQMSKESGYTLQGGELCVDEAFVHQSYDKQLVLAAAQLFLQQTWGISAQQPTLIKFDGHRWRFEYTDPSIPPLEHCRAYVEIHVAAGHIVYGTKELFINWAHEEYAKRQRANRRGLFVMAAIVAIVFMAMLISVYYSPQ